MADIAKLDIQIKATGIEQVNKDLDTLIAKANTLQKAASEASTKTAQAVKQSSEAVKKSSKETVDAVNTEAEATKEAEREKTKAVEAGAKQTGSILNQKIQQQQILRAEIQKTNTEESKAAKKPKATSSLGYSAESTKKATQAVNSYTGAVLKSTQAIDANSKAMRKWDSSFSLTGIVIANKEILSFTAVMVGLQDILKTGMEFESIESGLRAATGGAIEGASAFKYVIAESERLGLQITGVAQSFKLFSGSVQGTSLSVEEQRTIFSSMAEASSVLGLSVDDTAGVFRALGQIASKGTVQMEELKGQLGDRLPKALRVAADSMGMTMAQFTKEVEKGNVESIEFLKKFAAGYRQMVAKELPNATQKAQAEWSRLVNSFTLAKKALADSGLLDFAAESFRTIAAFIEDSREGIVSFGSSAASVLGTVKNIVGGVISVIAELKDIILIAMGAWVSHAAGSKIIEWYGSARTAIVATTASLQAQAIAMEQTKNASTNLNAAVQTTQRTMEQTKTTATGVNASLGMVEKTTKATATAFGVAKMAAIGFGTALKAAFSATIIGAAITGIMALIGALIEQFTTIEKKIERIKNMSLKERLKTEKDMANPEYQLLGFNTGMRKPGRTADEEVLFAAIQKENKLDTDVLKRSIAEANEKAKLGFTSGQEIADAATEQIERMEMLYEADKISAAERNKMLEDINNAIATANQASMQELNKRRKAEEEARANAEKGKNDKTLKARMELENKINEYSLQASIDTYREQDTAYQKYVKASMESRMKISEIYDKAEKDGIKLSAQQKLMIQESFAKEDFNLRMQYNEDLYNEEREKLQSLTDLRLSATNAALDLREEEAQLLNDGTAKEIELATIQHERNIANLEAQKTMAEGQEEYYDRLIELENKAYQKAINRHSLWSKMNDSFFRDFESGLSSAIEGAFKGKLTLKGFFEKIKDGLIKTVSDDFASSITNALKGKGSGGSFLSNFAKGMTLLGGATTPSKVSAGDIGTLVKKGLVTLNPETNTYTGSGIEISAGGDIKQGGDMVSQALGLANTASSLNSAYNLATGALSTSIGSGFTEVAFGTYDAMTALGFSSSTAAGAANGISSFGYGLSSPFASAGAGGAQGAGAMLGGAAIGAAGGYALGSLGDAASGAKTKAANYGAIGGGIGGAVGSVVPGIGTAIGALVGAAVGALVGGAIGTKKLDQIQIEIFNASADAVLANMKETYKTKSWFGTKTHESKYALTSEQEKAITGTIKTYDYLLTQLGFLDKKISIGRVDYPSIKDFLDIGVTKAFVEAIGALDVEAVYQSWKSYAYNINKSVQQAFAESISGFITSKRTFTEWQLGFSGKDTEALQFKANYLAEDLQMLTESMSVSGLTIENFVEKMDAAVKANFTPENIKQWQALGTALQSAEGAQKAYTQALQNTTLTLLNAELEQAQASLVRWVAALGAVQNAIDKLTPVTKTFSELAATALTDTNYESLISQLEQTRQREIERLTESSNARLDALEKEKNIFNQIQDYVKSLTEKIVGLSKATSTYFYAEIAKARQAMATGGDVNIRDVTGSANAYLDKVMAQSTSKLDYIREVAKVRGEVESLGAGVTGGSLAGIEAAINSEKETLAAQLMTLNETALAILNSWKGQALTGVNTAAAQVDKVQQQIKQAPALIAATREYIGGVSNQGLNDAQIAAAVTHQMSVAGVSAEIIDAAMGYPAGTTANYLQVNGSHASGLDYVPFDGYIAELHKGERVQTANEVKNDKTMEEVKAEISELKQITIKNTAEMTRMSKIFGRLDDGDALKVRVAV